MNDPLAILAFEFADLSGARAAGERLVLQDAFVEVLREGKNGWFLVLIGTEPVVRSTAGLAHEQAQAFGGQDVQSNAVGNRLLLAWLTNHAERTMQALEARGA